jgi:hypothetical protein
MGPWRKEEFGFGICQYIEVLGGKEKWKWNVVGFTTFCVYVE